MVAALDHPTYAIDARPRAIAVVARVASGFHAQLRALVNRRHLNHLALMSDHQLADIGLARGDLAVARRLPLGADPTAGLSRLAAERYSIEARRAG